MPNYKKMYFKLLSATEQVIHILLEARQECRSSSSPQPELKLDIMPLSLTEIADENED